MRIAAAAAAVLGAAILSAQIRAPFRLEETTIAQIHAAFRDGSLTCQSLVEPYLRRIEAHDKQGTTLNALVMVNPDALDSAAELDRRYRRAGPVGPMHCVPVLLLITRLGQDGYSSGGSLSQARYVSSGMKYMWVVKVPGAPGFAGL